MPELIEVEQYRRAVDVLVGRQIDDVVLPDPWFVKRGSPEELRASLIRRQITGTRRIGKLLLIDTDVDGPVLGVRFGMTGLVEVDGARPIGELLYSSIRRDPAWVRAELRTGGGSLAIVDPRRLGGVELDPDETRLGPDAATLTLGQLTTALASSHAPLKARLLDQARIAGIGNLLADEILWHAALAPDRAAADLDDRERRRLQRWIRATVATLLERGGSHLGDVIDARRPGGLCPRDGSPLRRATIGGRTTWWCPRHQR